MSKFVIRPVPSGVKFDLHSANGQRIATSETYRTKAACLKGIASVRKNAPSAGLEDRTVPDWAPCANPRFELYEDKAGEYRFRLKAANGKTVAASQGYASLEACLNGVESVRNCAACAPVKEV